MLLYRPLVRTEAADEEKDEADGEKTENDGEPHIIRERTLEGEDAPMLLVGLLDHDGRPCVHVRLGKIYYSLTNFSYGESSHSYICVLKTSQ